MKNENYKPDIVIHLRPTSPIRPKNLVDDSVRLLKKHPKADSVRGVVPSAQNPFKMWKLKDANSPMKNLINVPRLREPYNSPRQILPKTYWQTGQIDTIRTRTILEENSMSGKVIYPLIIDSKYSVDIDNLEDWERYEDLVSKGKLDLVLPDFLK
jgi:N-acylneuraminate cytidylyltransferase